MEMVRHQAPHAGISTCRKNNKRVFKLNWDVYEEVPKGKPLANINVPQHDDVSTWAIYFPT